jgi:small subunit ribosomal protein S7
MRRAKPERREISADIKYNNVLVQTLVRHMLHRGKKSTAMRVIYDTLDIIQKRNEGKDPIEVFEAALKNVAPMMEVRPRRVGGATYQVPMEVPSVRRTTLAIRWVLDSAYARAGKSFSEKLADELMDAFKNEGASIRKREETHKMAEANRAFSHYRM